MSLVVTGSQTVGPFFRIGLSGLYRADMTSGVGRKPDPAVVSVRGRVIDGDGNGVPDAVIEAWQQDTGGFARVPTEDDGSFTFRAAPSSHLNVTVFMRGLLRHLHTRMYFPGDPANSDDPILRLVEEQRRSTLIARPLHGAAAALEWNVVLQGEDETVFFEC